MLAEFGVAPVHLQARYLQRRCYARMLLYKFGSQFPWFGVTHDGWREEGITAEVVESDVVIENVISGLVIRDKDEVVANHGTLWDQYLDEDRHVFYTDGLSSQRRSGAGIVCYERGLRDDARSLGLPGEWCALECEIYGCFRALGSVQDIWPITVFMDCLPAIEMLCAFGSERRNAALANLFFPVLSRVGAVTLVWNPGHYAFRGNVVADMAAKDGCGMGVDMEARGGVVMNVRNNEVAKTLRTQEWETWHNEQAHGYYRWLPSAPRHFRGLLRWDIYVIVCLRSGAWDRRTHDGCHDREDRFHLSQCRRYVLGSPPTHTLFEDKDLSRWVAWWRGHDYLGTGVVKQKTSIRDVRVVGGNPFDTGCRISVGGGPTVLAKYIKPAVLCGTCGKTSMGVHRCRPNRPRRGMFDFVAPGYRGGCYVCGQEISRAVDEGAFSGWFRETFRPE